MKTRSKNMKNGQRGATAVEFALLLTFILAPLTAAIVDYGQILHAQYVITRAAREGAMAAVRGQDPTAVVNAYLQDAGLDLGHSTVSVSGAGGEGGTPASVTVGYDCAAMAIIPWDGISDGLTNLSTTATARN